MKIKIISIVLVICALSLCFVSCKNNDNNNNNNESPTYVPEKTPSEKVDDLIMSISDANSCLEAAKAYNKLSTEEKKEVILTTSLENAMEQYADDTNVRDYLMEYKAQEKSDYLHNSCRKKLINISSYTVNNQTSTVYYDSETNSYFLRIEIDFSAQNRFGGYDRSSTRDDYVWRDNYWKETAYAYDNSAQSVKIGIAINQNKYSVYDTYHFTFSAN